MTITEVTPLDPQQTVSEIVGRVVYVQTHMPWMTRQTYVKTVDETVGDYAFWDKLRRGKQDGYQFGGLLVNPITQIIASYTWGDGPTLALADGGNPDNENDPRTYTDSLLKRWLERNAGLFLQTLIDKYALGDAYIVVNGDGSLSVASPETVETEYSPLDARQPIAHTITTKTDTVTITDKYALTGRTVTLEWHKAVEELGVTTGQKQEFTFPNLIGRLPVVHWACDRGTNEQRGRPLAEPLLPLLSRYDDLIVAAMDGAEVMGHPIPAFVGLENIQDTIDANATAETDSYTDAQGNTQERTEIRFDTNATVWVGKGGDFKFVAPPGGWSNDLRDILKSLFYLILDNTRIPEFLWGGAIASSKASAETQLPPFVQYIGMRRQQVEGQGADDLLGMTAQGGLLELADVWLRTRALVDRRVVVAPVAAKWPEVAAEDETLQFQKVQWLHGMGLLTGATALETMDIVDDPARELEKADEEAKEAQEEQAAFAARLADEEQRAAGGEQETDAARRNGRQPEGVAV